MPNARVIKNRIKTVKNTGKITKTMAMVSTAKATKVIGFIRASRPYTDRMFSFLGALSQSCDTHPLFMANPKAEKSLLVVITANRGLCGGFNANIVRLAKAQVNAETEVWMFGKKGMSAFRFAKIPMSSTASDLKDMPMFDEAIALADRLVEAYESGLYREVRFVSMEYVSAGQQLPMLQTLLPMTVEAKAEEGLADFEPIYHPNKSGLLKDLVPRLIRLRVYRILLDSAASEHLARQMAMNSASDNAMDMVKALSLSYNRARQAQITTEISEIVGGAEALN
jgi:F-type H+-transporting ATPase subunit gamma